MSRSIEVGTVLGVARQKLRLMLSKDSTSVTSERIREVVDDVVAFLGLTDVNSDQVVRDLEASYQTTIGDPRLLTEDGFTPWLPKRRSEISWAFWDRYRSYLTYPSGWPEKTLVSLDRVTDDILGQLSDPMAPGQWDRRGMVVGHVQSGKTSNYVGLICKAADAGYKVIVVLAGFHKSLRSQTQIRLEEGFLGYDRGATTQNPQSARVRVGVGQVDLYGPDPLADSITTRADNGDFRRDVATNFAINPGGHPLLFVIKKNGAVLKNLLNWVRYVARERDEHNRPVIPDVPLLVIDDEADIGSIDTRRGAMDEHGRPDPDHDPTVLNKRIRELLRVFGRSAYVGYTATPFANVLIHEGQRTEAYGDDLFPKSFIVSLPVDSNYVGPARVFGITTTDETPRDPLPIIRHLVDHADSQAVDERSGWMPPRHNKDWVPLYQGEDRVPPSVEEAIRSFILACAARAARGDETEHNTMLVHVTRFTAVQKRVTHQVSLALDDVRRRLRHGDGRSEDSIRAQLRQLWLRDFDETHKRLKELGEAADCEQLAWEEVEEHLTDAALSIEVREVNGAAGDVLNYVDHQGSGLNVIAIGGDKLSRGLTLEGLSISYFLRASRMYDTLMQMGRWFGYRPRYLDLCRLYTTPELSDWFAHIAQASDELREDFDQMAASNATPREFGHRVRSHPSLLVTSAVKMQSGVKLDLSFEGSVVETVNFRRDRRSIESNFLAAQRLIAEAEARGSRYELASRRANAAGGAARWRHVPTELIAAFLDSYKEHSASRKVKTDPLANYIRKEADAGRLVDWTVFLASGTSNRELALGRARVHLTVRRWHGDAVEQQRFREEGHFRIRRLLSPSDEAQDLSDGELAAARAAAMPHERPDGQDPSVVGGKFYRSARPPERGLLLLYALDSQAQAAEASVEPEAQDIPLVGFGISFPSVDPAVATRVQYVVNNVYWTQEMNMSEPDDFDGTY